MLVYRNVMASYGEVIKAGEFVRFLIKNIYLSQIIFLLFLLPHKKLFSFSKCFPHSPSLFFSSSETKYIFLLQIFFLHSTPLSICVHIKWGNACIEGNPGGIEILGMKVWQIEIVVKCIGVSRSGVDGWQLVEVAASPWHPTPPTAPTHSLGFYSPPPGFVGKVICISSAGLLHFS